MMFNLFMMEGGVLSTEEGYGWVVSPRATSDVGEGGQPHSPTATELTPLTGAIDL